MSSQEKYSENEYTMPEFWHAWGGTLETSKFRDNLEPLAPRSELTFSLPLRFYYKNYLMMAWSKHNSADQWFLCQACAALQQGIGSYCHCLCRRPQLPWFAGGGGVFHHDFSWKKWPMWDFPWFQYIEDEIPNPPKKPHEWLQADFYSFWPGLCYLQSRWQHASYLAWALSSLEMSPPLYVVGQLLKSQPSGNLWEHAPKHNIYDLYMFGAGMKHQIFAMAMLLWLSH